MYSNQITLEVGAEECKNVEEIFTNQIRVSIKQPSFNKSELLDIFKQKQRRSTEIRARRNRLCRPSRNQK